MWLYLFCLSSFVRQFLSIRTNDYFLIEKWLSQWNRHQVRPYKNSWNETIKRYQSVSIIQWIIESTGYNHNWINSLNVLTHCVTRAISECELKSLTWLVVDAALSMDSDRTITLVLGVPDVSCATLFCWNQERERGASAESRKRKLYSSKDKV